MVAHLRVKVQYLRPLLPIVLVSCSLVTDPLYLHAHGIYFRKRLAISASHGSDHQTNKICEYTQALLGISPAFPDFCTNPAEQVSNTCRLLSCREAAGTCVTAFPQAIISLTFPNSCTAKKSSTSLQGGQCCLGQIWAVQDVQKAFRISSEHLHAIYEAPLRRFQSL